MKEGIAARVGRVISGGTNMLIDAMENVAPELVMEQAVREVDGVLDDVRTELGRIAANKHLASKRLMDENKEHEELAGKIDLAIEQNREDLAEAAVALQLDIEAQIPVLENTIADCAEREKEFEGYLNALIAKKRQMQQELRRFRESREKASTASGKSATGLSKNSTDSKVARAESAFDRVLERSTGLPGSPGRDMRSAGQLAELEDLARKNRIQERLAAAKARAKGNGQ